MFLGRLGHQSGFPNRMRQRLLAIDMLAHPHGRHRRVAMSMVGRGNGDRVEVLLLLQHHAKIAIQPGLRIEHRLVAVPLRPASIVHVAQGHNCAPGASHAADLASALAPDADTPHVDPVVGPEYPAGNERSPNRQGTGCSEKLASRRSISCHLFVLRKVISARPDVAPKKCNQTHAAMPTLSPVGYASAYRRPAAAKGRSPASCSFLRASVVNFFAHEIHHGGTENTETCHFSLAPSAGRSSTHLGFFFLYS